MSTIFSPWAVNPLTFRALKHSRPPVAVEAGAPSAGAQAARIAELPSERRNRACRFIGLLLLDGATRELNCFSSCASAHCFAMNRVLSRAHGRRTHAPGSGDHAGGAALPDPRNHPPRGLSTARLAGAGDRAEIHAGYREDPSPGDTQRGPQTGGAGRCGLEAERR